MTWGIWGPSGAFWGRSGLLGAGQGPFMGRTWPRVFRGRTGQFGGRAGILGAEQGF